MSTTPTIGRRCAICRRPIFELDESKRYEIVVATDISTVDKTYEYDCKRCMEDAISNAHNSPDLTVIDVQQVVENKVFIQVAITPKIALENLLYEVQTKRF